MQGDVLWLGLHKTGTTFLQKSLDLSQPALIAAGIAWVSLDEFRRKWTRPLLHDGHDTPPAPADLPPGLRHRLVFDENIPALVQHGLKPRGFYPRAGERARIIADHLHLERPLLVLGLRGFASFVPSLYCETLKSTPFKPFRAFLRQPVEAMSWLPLIDRLLAAFPGSDLLLYRAEDLPGQEARLLSRVTGLPESAFTLLGAPERVGFSQEAVMRLHAMAEAGPVSQAEVHRLVRDLPRGPGRPGFMPWNAGEKALLDAAYARDLAEVKARAARPDGRMIWLDLAVPA